MIRPRTRLFHMYGCIFTLALGLLETALGQPLPSSSSTSQGTPSLAVVPAGSAPLSKTPTKVAAPSSSPGSRAVPPVASPPSEGRSERAGDLAKEPVTGSQPSPGAPLPVPLNPAGVRSRTEALDVLRIQIDRLRAEATANLNQAERIRLQSEALHNAIDAFLSADRNGQPQTPCPVCPDCPSPQSCPVTPGPPQVRFYHLWSTFCKPCLAELPEVITLARNLHAQNVKVQIIAEEGDGDPNEAVALFHRFSGPGHLLRAIRGFERKLRQDFGLPTVIQPITILSCNGQALFKKEGRLLPTELQYIKQAVEATLRSKSCRSK